VTTPRKPGIRKRVADLLELARLLGPEGEDLDLSDMDLDLGEIVAISNRLGQLRTAGEVVKRSLAQVWNDQHKGKIFNSGIDTYYLGYASKRVFQEGQDLEFARWLKGQDVEMIRDIISVTAIRVTPLGRPDSPLRESFFDEEKTSDDLRIQSKPNRGG
jgi:hypothetical protein